jgi:antitoxin PrlF
MIIGKITAKAQTTIPQAVRRALGLLPGDDIEWEIEGDKAVICRARRSPDPFIGNFSTFTEWASEADCEAFDNF